MFSRTPVLSRIPVAGPTLSRPAETSPPADVCTPADDRPRRHRRRLRALAGSQRGMTTAEYAVGTVAACGFGGVLYKVVTSDQVARLLSDVLRRALTMTF